MSKFRQAKWAREGEKLEPTVFEKSDDGKKGYSFAESEIEEDLEIPKNLEREGIMLLYKTKIGIKIINYLSNEVR